MGQATCSIAGCDKHVIARGWCAAHYTRWHRHGDPLAPLVRQPNSGSCSVAGCDQPMRKRGWCAGHYAMWRESGLARPFAYKWGEGGPCRQCGNPCARTYCSDKCKAMWHRNEGERPDAVSCAGCGATVSLSDVGRAGRRRRADVKLCHRCKQDSRKHGVSVLFLVARDGDSCGICLEPVDMSLIAPDLMRPSVDHVTPRARGGTNDPSNLQLAHLWCNQIKSDRVGA